MRERGAGRAKFEWLALPVLLGIGCAGLYLMAAANDRWHDAFDYRRTAIASGQLWRLVTAHLMHVNAAHVVLDVAGLLLVAWIFAREFEWRRQALALLIGAAFVDFGLWFFHPEVARYVGLSGAVHALFAAGATRWLLVGPATHDDDADDDAADDATDSTADDASRLRLHRAWGAALLIGLVVKLVLESRGDAFWLHGTNLDVVTAAHRWGSAAGALYAAACGFASARIVRTQA